MTQQDLNTMFAIRSKLILVAEILNSLGEASDGLTVLQQEQQAGAVAILRDCSGQILDIIGDLSADEENAKVVN